MRLDLLRGLRRREAKSVGHKNAIEALESRRLLTAASIATLQNASFQAAGAGQQTVDLGQYFADPQAPANTVFMQTSLGNIPIQLTPSATPLTVANFLNYVRSGRYADTIFHRSVNNFVIQGGGFGVQAGQVVDVQTDAPVVNEYSAARLNTRGTIAMAKTSDPNSATSQFFLNLGDNTSSLNNTSNSGGFTVFGSIVGNAGLSVMDAIAAVPRVNAGGAFAELPVIGFQQSQQNIDLNQLVYVKDVTEGAAYTVTSDNPAIVTAKVQGKNLLYTPVANGVAHITVTAKGIDGQAVSQTFTVTVGDTPVVDPEPTPPAAEIAVGKGGKKSITFKDKDGTTATITVAGPGKATLQFDGTNASVKDSNGAGTVSGTNLTLRSIVLTGTTATTVVKVITKGGNGSINLGGLTATGAAGTLDGKGVVLVGDTVVGGAVKAITVKSAAAGSTIQAGSIGSFTATGGSAADVTATGAVGNVAVAGTLGGTWRVGSVKMLTAGTIANATLASTVGGTSIGAVIAKKVSGSLIRSAGNIASVVVTGNVSASQIFAGVSADGAVSAEDAAKGNGQILMIKIGAGPKGNAFANSAIAAKTIKNATFGNLVDTASTAAFYGIEADTITSMTGFVGGKAFSIKNATTQAQVDSQLAKAKVAPKNLKIVVV